LKTGTNQLLLTLTDLPLSILYTLTVYFFDWRVVGGAELSYTV